MKEPSLKPCPFCGGKAEIRISGFYKGGRDEMPSQLQGYVHCVTCGARAGQELIDFNLTGMPHGLFQQKKNDFYDNLAKEWNERAKPTRPQRFTLPEERCGTCRYFDDTVWLDEGFGACLHDAPVVKSSFKAGQFPRMHTNNWCGKWKSTIIDPKDD